MPEALLEIFRAGLERWKKKVQKGNRKKRIRKQKESKNKKKVKTETYPVATGISRFR
jgi:hypothetical protein